MSVGLLALASPLSNPLKWPEKVTITLKISTRLIKYVNPNIIRYFLQLCSVPRGRRNSVYVREVRLFVAKTVINHCATLRLASFCFDKTCRDILNRGEGKLSYQLGRYLLCAHVYILVSNYACR